MKEEDLELGVCNSCFGEVVVELIKRKSQKAEEYKFISLLVSVMGISINALKTKGRGGKAVLARSLHVVFMRQYMGMKPKKIMPIYGLDRSTYYNCLRVVEQLGLTSGDRLKYGELLAAYPKLLEDHTKEWNKNVIKGI